jgi:hypothetical protein
MKACDWQAHYSHQPSERAQLIVSVCFNTVYIIPSGLVLGKEQYTDESPSALHSSRAPAQGVHNPAKPDSSSPAEYL